MNYSDYRFTLDIRNTLQSQVSIPVRIGDTAKKLYIDLADGSEPYTIVDGCIATFAANKPDGEFIFNSCVIEKNRTIIYELSHGSVSAPGIVNCEIRLYGADGKMITSPQFVLVVDSRVLRDEDILSESEKTAVDAILSTEAARAAAETARVQAESGRASAESERVNAENARARAESGRSAVEAARVSAETARAQAETARINAEKGRVDAEAARVQAENARNNAETRRETDTAAAIASFNGVADQAVISFNTIADKAIASAEGKAREAAGSAQAAEGSANASERSAQAAEGSSSRAAESERNAEQAYQDLIGEQFKWMGEYDVDITYSKHDCVKYNGSVYIALNDIEAGVEPEQSSEWDMMVSSGTDGTMTFEDLTPEQKEELKGDPGPQGFANVHYGTSVPDNSLGEDGDIYIMYS